MDNVRPLQTLVLCAGVIQYSLLPAHRHRDPLFAGTLLSSSIGQEKRVVCKVVLRFNVERSA